MSGAKGPVERKEGERPLVLIAEDDPDVLKMIAKLIGPFADCLLAKNGADAFSMMQGSGPVPDLVITDLMMPMVDGLSLVRKIKLDANLSRVPVIILTARGAPSDTIAGIKAGARNYLTKPFKADELVAKVKKALKIT